MSTDEIFTNSSMFNRILGNGHTNSLGNIDRVGGYTGSDGEGRIRAVDISYEIVILYLMIMEMSNG